MKQVLFARQMREAENAYFASGARSIELMERAAAKVTEALIRRVGCAGKTCVFLCGTGGNGGDGLAAARMFAMGGGRAVVMLTGDMQTPDAKENLARAKECVYAFTTPDEIRSLPGADAWVDAAFGIGLSRPVAGALPAAFEFINCSGAFVLSVDIPSGLHADTGEILGACVRADETVTFQTRKVGQLLGRGPEMCGRLTVEDIGIPEEFMPTDAPRIAEAADALCAMPPRPRDAHKNDFGHLLIISGSRGMAGAALIAARAALSSGVGLVSVACPASLTDIIQTGAPCAMCVPLPEADGALSAAAAAPLARAIKGKSAAVVGPGLSMRAAKECVEAVLRAGIPAAVDADALNLIALHPSLRALLTQDHVITPHPGEAARLLGGARVPPVETVNALKALGCVPLYKGAVSLIGAKQLIFSASGTVGMAKGGSGDALSGILGALLAQGVPPEKAAWAASELHGLAGEIAARRKGVVSMTAMDLIDALPAVFMQNEYA